MISTASRHPTSAPPSTVSSVDGSNSNAASPAMAHEVLRVLLHTHEGIRWFRYCIMSDANDEKPCGHTHCFAMPLSLLTSSTLPTSVCSCRRATGHSRSYGRGIWPTASSNHRQRASDALVVALTRNVVMHPNRYLHHPALAPLRLAEQPRCAER